MGMSRAISLWPRWLFRKSRHESGTENLGHKRYLFATICLLMALLFRAALGPVLHDELPYAFFSPAAMLAAWYGRFLPGIFVLTSGLFCGHYFFVAQGEFASLKTMEGLRILSTAVPAFISIWIIELLHRARIRADEIMAEEKKHAKRLHDEIVERQKAEKELRFSQEITRALSEADNFRAAMGIALHKVCKLTGWALGHAWVPLTNKSQIELCPEICSCHPQLEEFQKASESIKFAPGIGMVGRVWRTKKPEWIRDVQSAPGFLRATAAQKAGIKSALFFPIIANDEVVAILEFFHVETREEDEAFVNLISAVALQLGDLMQRKQAEEKLQESEKQLNEAQAIAHVGNWEWNVETNELAWSAEVYRLFGIAPADFDRTYAGFINRVHPDDRSLIESVIQNAFRDGRPFEFEHRLVRPNGEIRVLHCYGKAVRNSAGKIINLFGTAQDITEQKQVQLDLASTRQRLQNYASLLEKKVAARTADLEKSLRETENLLYTIAHDLRAPLRAMSGLTHVIFEDYASLMDSTAKDYAQRVIKASQQMDRLILDLLAYGRLTHVDLPKTDIHLDELVDNVLAQFQNEARDMQAQIEVVRPLPIVLSNATVLEQIMTNLISNALKFKKKDVPPWIQIFAEERDATIRINVQDNGIGIPKEFQERIFSVFEKLHRHEDYEGTGIGLAVVNKGAERLGGKAGVESEVGKGSCFWIELPKDHHATKATF